MTGRVILCGAMCGHRHDSINGPTGCCADHGPYLYYCSACHDAARIVREQAPTTGGGL